MLEMFEYSTKLSKWSKSLPTVAFLEFLWFFCIIFVIFNGNMTTCLRNDECDEFLYTWTVSFSVLWLNLYKFVVDGIVKLF